MTLAEASEKVLVLGVGNLLMADDGVGVRAVQLLSELYDLPEEVTVLDGGTMGLDLLEQVQDAARLLVVDAAETGYPPGTLARYSGEEISLTPETKLSPHQLGLKDLLAVASLLGAKPEETVLWGVQPESIRLSLGLSPAVEERLETLVGKLIEELARWGVTARLRNQSGMQIARVSPSTGSGRADYAL